MNQSTSTVLMVKPASFGYNAETAASNFFQQTEPWNVQQKAVEEFDAVVSTLREHGIEVIVIQDTADPLKPDAVFPNNWFRCDGKELTLFPMLAENRRAERRKDIVEELVARYNLSIRDLTRYESEYKFLEGTGSIICDHINRVMYACISPRTDRDLFIDYAKSCGYKPVCFFATDNDEREIYHTNVMMCIGTGYTILCEEAINADYRDEVLNTLKSGGHEIIPISRMQVMQFAGNMLELQGKGKLLLMSAAAFTSLTGHQLSIIRKFAEPLITDVTSIEHTGGGSVRCMVAEIFRSG